MSKDEYPYDNVPIERYFNTLKNDFIYLYYYSAEKEKNALRGALRGCIKPVAEN